MIGGTPDGRCAGPDTGGQCPRFALVSVLAAVPCPSCPTRDRQPHRVAPSSDFYAAVDDGADTITKG
jgi:hypothetical protein